MKLSIPFPGNLNQSYDVSFHSLPYIPIFDGPQVVESSVFFLAFALFFSSPWLL